MAHHTLTIDLDWPDTVPVALEQVAPEVVASCVGLAAHMADQALTSLGIPAAITITRTTHTTGPPMQLLDPEPGA